MASYVGMRESQPDTVKQTLEHGRLQELLPIKLNL